MTETVTIEKQVWESTLHCSMVLQAENNKLKKWREELNAFALKVAKENAQLKELLTECRRPVCWYVDIFKNKAELLTKIDEALK